MLLVDTEIVEDLLQLYVHKYMGLHGIHPRILKDISNVIKKYPSIFEWYWESRKVPADWKLANVLVFKKNKKEDPGNHRACEFHFCAWQSYGEDYSVKY